MTDRIWESFVGKTETRILMVGLDAAGSTTKFVLEFDEAAITILTIGLVQEFVFHHVWRGRRQDSASPAPIPPENTRSGLRC